MRSTEYIRGWDAADAHIYKGEDPKTLLAQAMSDLNEDDFHRGWTSACEEEIRFNADCDREMAEIDKMTPEEITAQLHAWGYTEERLEAAYERFRQTIEKYKPGAA
jgi:hypothetical protein